MNLKSFKSTRDRVLEGKFGKIKSLKKCLVPFDTKLLNTSQLREELMSIGVKLNPAKSTKGDLMLELKRFPVLLCLNPNVDLKTLH